MTSVAKVPIMAGGTAVAARAAPTAANPATDAKADDAAMARAKPKADAAALLAGGAGADSKLRVLLVEDDHSTLVFVKALLKSCGHTGTSPTAPRRRRNQPPTPLPRDTRDLFTIFFWKVFPCG